MSEQNTQVYPAVLTGENGATIAIGRYAMHINQFEDLDFGTRYELNNPSLNEGDFQDWQTVLASIGIRDLLRDGRANYGDISRSVSLSSWNKALLDERFCPDGVYVSCMLQLNFEEELYKTLWEKCYPKCLLHLLAGYLQRGEEPIFANFRRYRTGEGVSFQPFGIYWFGVRYHLFHPTLERIQSSPDFTQDAVHALEIFRSISIDTLINTLDNMRTLVCLTEAQLHSERDFSDLIAEELGKFEQRFGEQKGRMGFVYGHLSGSKSALPISPKYLQRY